MIRFHQILSARRWWRFVGSALGGLCFFMLLSLPRLPAIAQVNQATIREILDGDRVFIEQEQATISDSAQFRQTIRTEGETRASLAFNNGATGRLGQNASVTVGQCIEVERGQLLISGPANGCMADFSVAVQGTIYAIEKDPDSPQGSSGTLRVLEGNVQLLTGKDKRQSAPVQVSQGQQIGITQIGLPGTLRAIPPEEFAEIVNGPLFKDYRESLPNQDKLQGVCQSLYPTYDCTSLGAPVAPQDAIPGLW